MLEFLNIPNTQENRNSPPLTQRNTNKNLLLVDRGCTKKTSILLKIKIYYSLKTFHCWKITKDGTASHAVSKSLFSVSHRKYSVHFFKINKRTAMHSLVLKKNHTLSFPFYTHCCVNKLLIKNYTVNKNYIHGPFLSFWLSGLLNFPEHNF